MGAWPPCSCAVLGIAHRCSSLWQMICLTWSLMQQAGQHHHIIATTFQRRLRTWLDEVTTPFPMQVVMNVTNNTTPARIVLTGYAEGGALAKLAAVWAGAAFAGAQIRSINFGAPRVGGDRCAGSFYVLLRRRHP